MDPLKLFEKNLRPFEFWIDKANRKIDEIERGEALGLSSGFPSLDHFSRLKGGELIILAARPSMGKTALALQIAMQVAGEMRRQGDNGCVAFFSAEMGGISLVFRLVGTMTGINMHAFSQGRGTAQDFAAIRSSIAKIKNLPIWIDDNRRPTTATMLADLAMLQKTIPPRLMIFDFLELGGDGGRQSEEQRISNIAQHLTGIAGKLDIPVLALSQLNRAVEARQNKKPTLADLRYSGMLEQVADVVMLLHRPEYYLQRGQDLEVAEEDRKGVALLNFAKNRHGPAGVARLGFVEERVSFGELKRIELNGVGP